MEELVSTAQEIPESADILLSAQSDTEAFHGRVRNAQVFVTKAIASARQNGAPDRIPVWQSHAALWEAELGNVVQARRLASAELAVKQGKELQGEAASAVLAIARSGAADNAETILRNLPQPSPTDVWMNKYYLPSIQAAIELDRANPAHCMHWR